MQCVFIILLFILKVFQWTKTTFHSTGTNICQHLPIVEFFVTIQVFSASVDEVEVFIEIKKYGFLFFAISEQNIIARKPHALSSFQN